MGFMHCEGAMIETAMGKLPPDEGAGAFGWIVVKTHPNREPFAMGNLVRQKFEVYCPQVRKTLTARGVRREVLRPLFANYLFVRAPLGPLLWRPVLSTYGVRQVVHFGDHIPSLDARFIDALRDREVDGAIVKPPSPFEVGEQIGISGGPFDGLVARIIEISSNDRLTILMDLLGQSVRGRIHAGQVRKLAPA